MPGRFLAQQLVHLQCNYAGGPAVISDRQPRLSWQIVSETRGFYQEAYRILVATSEARLARDDGDAWDSGKRHSGQNLYLPYGGKPLRQGERYFWKVRIWDRKGKASPWSAPSSWQMGPLSPGDWKARWITASAWFTPPAFRPKGLQVGTGGGWADVDLGKPVPVEEIRLYPFDSASFPRRFRVMGAGRFDFRDGVVLADERSTPGGAEMSPAGHRQAGVRVFRVAPKRYRFIRLYLPADTATKEMTVRQMEVLSGGKNVALMKSTREYGTDWSHGHAPFLVDGMPSREEGADCPAGACPSTAAPMFRKSFSVQKNVRRAMVYVAALGMADVTLNGHRVGNDVLGPPFTDYTKAVMYSAYDITGSLKPGDNAFGVVLGNGFFSTPSLGFGQRQNGFGPPRFLLQAVIDYDDGSRQWVTSDPSWTWARSEIVFNDVWWGYAEDRHLARQGWDCPGYDGDGWQKAALAAAPAGKLVARSGPPNRIDGILRPVRVQGNHAYFPVVSAGWPLLKVNGRAGQTITLSGDGPGYSMPHISFVLAKDGPDTLSPRFVILPGPMDMTVDGLDDRLSIDDICIQEVHADLEQTGTFACANPYLDTLFQVAMRTHRNYVNDIPADPNREKQGWTQDVQNMFTTAAYFTDVRDLYERWWRDMRDNQDAQGYLGSVVPMMNRQVYDWNSPWWSGMIVFLPWEHYLFYGNREILETAFPAMARYVDFLASMAATGEGRGWDDYPYFTHNLDTAAARTGMLIWNGAGDWNNPYNATQHAVPTPMTTMPAWYAYARIVSKTAALLGKEQEARTYAKMAETVRQRFNRAYFHPATGLYGDSVNSETAQVLPLAVGMVPDQKVDGTLARLVDAIHAHGDHIGTGFVGTSFLLGELAGYGLSGLANRMVNQQDYPGWKTLTKGGVFMEQWNGGGAQMPSCGGAVGAWLFQSALGIRPLAEHPGFKEFILAPQPDPATGLTWARGSYRTGYGRVSVAWTYDKGRFVLDVDVPANTTAWVYLPAAGQGPDRAATAARRIGSGKYHFDVPLLNASRP